MIGIIIAIVAIILAIYLMAARKSKNNSRHAQRIPDKYKSLQEVQEALRISGLESCNLIVAVDFTKSNDFQGEKTFHGKPLHSIDETLENPYQQALRIIGTTLRRFDEDELIPAFGFGDITTKSHSCFSFFPTRPCHTLDEVLTRYTELAQVVKLSGPTSFAPVIRKAIEIVKETKDFHVLIIVADGQVTSPPETIQAITEAAHYPLAIIMVGVGDGPWDDMHLFDDDIPEREFDNFQFVEFHKAINTSQYPEAAFALQALMELPQQYQYVRKLNYV